MRRIAFLLAGLGTCGAAQAQAAPGVCAHTTNGALLAQKFSAVLPFAEPSPRETDGGYRVGWVRWDPLLGRGWAAIESCDHRERPSFWVQIAMEAPRVAARETRVLRGLSATAISMVHSGDQVRLWSVDGKARIEIGAVAEENGAAGDRVRLRLQAASGPDGEAEQPRYVAGIVRGPLNVEMVP